MVELLSCSYSVVLVLRLHSLFCRTQNLSACEEDTPGSETQNQDLKLSNLV